MVSSFVDIIDWVKELDYWEQAAFDLIISGEEISDKHLNQLVLYLLSENQLSEDRVDTPELKYKEYLITAEEDRTYQLTKISNLRNINALAPNQTLEFGSHLTAIFGVNGSGKSGYARVLGSAGFTRGDEEVIPDITKPFDPEASQLVDIELVSGGEEIHLEHQVGKPCPELSSFYAFDSTSVIVHLTQKNSISFAPAGLSNLQRLAKLTDDVREKLGQFIESKKKENIFVSYFHGESTVKELVDSISHETDLNTLKEKAAFTVADDEMLKNIHHRINTIKTKGISQQIKELKQSKADLEQLISKIKEVVDGLDSSVIADINQEITDIRSSLDAANKLGFEHFKSGHLASVGTEEWHTFIHSAKALGLIEEGGQEASYPKDDSHCLLCQQPLSEEAKKLVEQLWQYLGSSVQKQLRLAEQVLKTRLDEILAIDTEYFDSDMAISRLILDRDENLHSIIVHQNKALSEYKENVKVKIQSREEVKPVAIAADYVASIEKVIEDIVIEISKWEEEEGEIENLEAEARELEHRKLLLKYLPDIKQYILELIWINKASKIGGSTRHITSKYNQMFGELVTDEYIELFEKILVDLGRPLKVKITTQARKGEVYKQLVLDADDSTPARLANPDKILSEGEKRAVALADFLTEISLDSSSRGIILDDPVTSLDIDWRKMIARILSIEAKHRQVIIFTHDMPFLYYLRQASEVEDVTADYHWITRGGDDELPGYIHLHNSPVLEKDYRSDRRARDCYEEAKGAPPEKRQALIREGFAALRTSYEAVIMFDLFKEVVRRFEERTKFMNLKNIVWDNDLADKIVEKCELCSSLMEGHSHSDALGADFPKPKMLLEEIEQFNQIKKEAKRRR